MLRLLHRRRLTEPGEYDKYGDHGPDGHKILVCHLYAENKNENATLCLETKSANYAERHANLMDLLRDKDEGKYWGEER